MRDEVEAREGRQAERRGRVRERLGRVRYHHSLVAGCEQFELLSRNDSRRRRVRRCALPHSIEMWTSRGKGLRSARGWCSHCCWG